MQTVYFAHPVQHFLTEFQAVIDGRGLNQIKHGVIQIAVTAFAYAADLVRFILGLRQELRRRTGGTFGR
ncbi:hypothetical protein D3C78_1770810 [compost metagenome]